MKATPVVMVTITFELLLSVLDEDAFLAWPDVLTQNNIPVNRKKDLDMLEKFCLRCWTSSLNHGCETMQQATKRR